MRPVLLLVAILSSGGIACSPGTSVASGSAPTVARGAPAPIGTLVGEMPVVNGLIDGLAASLLLDTGASVSCVHPAAALRLGRIATGSGHLSGVGDRSHSVPRYGGVTLTLGPYTTPIHVLHGCPSLGIPGRNGQMIDGVLGSDGLRGIMVLIDYPGGVIRAAPNWTVLTGDSAAALPITFASELPTVTVDIWMRDAWVAVSLLLDTGADASLLLNAEAATALDVEPDPTEAIVHRRGLGGPIATQLVHAPRARVGSLEIRDVPIEVAITGMERLEVHGIRGVAGAEFLSHFRLGLDLGNGRLSLVVPGNRRTLCGSRSGICVADGSARDGYPIESVRPRSSAARSGIATGEVILRIGPVRTAGMSARQVRTALRSPNAPLSLVILDLFGRTRRVDLRIDG